jgi:hypothetical protein
MAVGGSFLDAQQSGELELTARMRETRKIADRISYRQVAQNNSPLMNHIFCRAFDFNKNAAARGF